MIGLTGFKALFDLNTTRLNYSKDFLWVSFGQLLSAVGSIVGIRLLTEYLSPQVFGELTLLMGGVMLVTALSANPILQALIRYYPEYDSQKEITTLLATVMDRLRKAISFLFILLSPVAVYLYWQFDKSVYHITLFALIVVIEVIRNYEFAILNASRKQVLYATWSVLESWFRPLLAIILVVLFEANISYVLLAYLLASIFIFILLKLKNPSVGNNYFSINNSTDKNKNLKEKIKIYSIPLIPLALIGWASGLGDRYIIGSLMSVADAGIYAAIYGLISRPFLLAGRVFELSLRPGFQQAVSGSDYLKANKILFVWLSATVFVVTVGCILVAFLQEQISYFLLGENFRSGSHLMIWIAIGYAILVTSYVFERVCYAYDKTQYILWIQCFGILIGCIATVFGILNYGLTGAAIAVPIYFGVQLLVSIVFAKRSISRAN